MAHDEDSQEDEQPSSNEEEEETDEPLKTELDAGKGNMSIAATAVLAANAVEEEKTSPIRTTEVNQAPTPTTSPFVKRRRTEDNTPIQEAIEQKVGYTYK